MSVRAISAVWDARIGSHSAKLVLLALADNANDAGVAWPSLDTIARKSELSRRSVIDQIAFLEAAGLLTCERTPGKSTLYRVLPHGALVQALHGSTSERHAPPLVKLLHGSGARNAPPTREGGAPLPVQEVHGTGARLAQGGAGAAPEPSLTVIEPSTGERDTPSPAAEGSGIPRAGFPTRQQVLEYATSQGWDVKAAAAFWLHHDDRKSQGEPYSMHWHWWSRLEKWILDNERGLGRGFSPKTPASTKPTITDYDKPQDWTPEQMTLGQPANPAKTTFP